MTRKEAREQAFLILFEHLIQDKPIDEIYEDAWDARDCKLNAFGDGLVRGTVTHLSDIEQAIEPNLKGWSLMRLPKVTRTILRLAVYEILMDTDIPVSVSINEAVELSKMYAGEGDPAYINGVLSSIEKQEYHRGEA